MKPVRASIAPTARRSDQELSLLMRASRTPVVVTDPDRARQCDLRPTRSVSRRLAPKKNPVSAIRKLVGRAKDGKRHRDLVWSPEEIHRQAARDRAPPDSAPRTYLAKFSLP